MYAVTIYQRMLQVGVDVVRFRFDKEEDAHAFVNVCLDHGMFDTDATIAVTKDKGERHENQ